MLTVTDEAIEKFEELLNDENKPEALIRLFIQSIG
jgi:Fe-S cluster assembly iron-binding protein IscA